MENCFNVLRKLRFLNTLIIVRWDGNQEYWVHISKYCRINTSCFSFDVPLNVSFPRRELRGVAGWVWGSRLGEARHQAAEDQEETPRPLLPGSGVWAGAALQAAALPVRPGERAPGQLPETHLHPGQDLVPEQEVQMQEAAAGQDSGDGRSSPSPPPPPTAAAQEGGCAGAGPGRQALSDRIPEL